MTSFNRRKTDYENAMWSEYQALETAILVLQGRKGEILETIKEAVTKVSEKISQE